MDSAPCEGCCERKRTPSAVALLVLSPAWVMAVVLSAIEVEKPVQHLAKIIVIHLVSDTLRKFKRTFRIHAIDRNRPLPQRRKERRIGAIAKSPGREFHPVRGTHEGQSHFEVALQPVDRGVIEHDGVISFILGPLRFGPG